MNTLSAITHSFVGINGPELITLFLIISFILVIELIPAILAFLVLSRVPAQYRKQEPALAFLLIIPIFSLVWMFFVHPRVAESLKSYFAVNGDTSHGDCGASLALAMCICSLCSLIPFIGFIGGMAALVLMIIFYVKAFALSSQIVARTIPPPIR